VPVAVNAPSSGSPPYPEEKGEPSLRVTIGRTAQIFLGLFSIGFAVVALATPLVSVRGLIILVAESVVILSAQSILAGGRMLSEGWLGPQAPQFWQQVLRSGGILGVGVLGVALAAFAVFDPSLAATWAVFVLAGAIVLMGLARLFQASGVSLPWWLRGSLLSTGVLIVVLVILAATVQGLALSGFAILVGIILLVTGIETVVTGLHPTDPRQFVLLKLLLFSAFYGLILINWIDLYGKSVPAYGIWLILTYAAPFGVLIVFEGWRSWPLAVSLALLVSLMNDVGYFFIGNLIFGFHENLGPWIAGQLGFLGNQVVTYFEAGAFSITVTSWMMGLSIYLRAAVVGVILYYWWRHPGQIVARTDVPVPGSPV
jgi:hypothetical protein